MSHWEKNLYFGPSIDGIALSFLLSKVLDKELNEVMIKIKEIEKVIQIMKEQGEKTDGKT